MNWAEYFTPAAYSGSPYGTGNMTTDGTISPECLVLHELRRHLADDTLLKTIFGDTGNEGCRIEVFDFPPPIELRDLPRLYLSIGDLSSLFGPGDSDLKTEGILATIRWDSDVTPVDAGKATIWSCVRKIKQVVQANDTMLVSVNGQNKQTARITRMRAASEPRIEDVGKERLALSLPIGIEMELDVNYSTGRIHNLEASL